MRKKIVHAINYRLLTGQEGGGREGGGREGGGGWFKLTYILGFWYYECNGSADPTNSLIPVYVEIKYAGNFPFKCGLRFLELSPISRMGRGAGGETTGEGRGGGGGRGGISCHQKQQETNVWIAWRISLRKEFHAVTNLTEYRKNN